MKWNNRRERTKFERNQSKLRKQYTELGMTETQIQTMHDFDLAEFNSRRREAEHTHRLDEADLDNETVELESITSSRYAWIDEIENDYIAGVIKGLSPADIELLTKYIFEGFSLSEIARMESVSQQAVSKKFQRIKKIFLKGL